MFVAVLICCGICIVMNLWCRVLLILWNQRMKWFGVFFFLSEEVRWQLKRSSSWYDWCLLHQGSSKEQEFDIVRTTWLCKKKIDFENKYYRETWVNMALGRVKFFGKMRTPELETFGVCYFMWCSESRRKDGLLHFLCKQSSQKFS